MEMVWGPLYSVSNFLMGNMNFPQKNSRAAIYQSFSDTKIIIFQYVPGGKQEEDALYNSYAIN